MRIRLKKLNIKNLKSFSVYINSKLRSDITVYLIAKEYQINKTYSKNIVDTRYTTDIQEALSFIAQLA